MKRDISLYIDDIIDCIEKIESYTKEIKEKEFIENSQLQDAVTRRIEVIGEAVKNVPASFREKHPQIPWKSIAGMRDLVIHSYFGINLLRIWKVVIEDIPKLKKEIVLLKEEMNSHK